MPAMITKSYADRLRHAMAMSDKASDAEQGIAVMKRALLAEIKTVDALQDMAGFRAWLEGERLDMCTIKARKR